MTLRKTSAASPRFERVRLQGERLRSLLATIAGTTAGKSGLVITAAFLLVSFVGPFFVPYPPGETVARSYLAPSWSHLLGTDDIGRDLFSELIVSIRGSVVIGLLAGLITVTVGSAIGLAAGYRGGVLDEILMRITDAMLVIPILVLLLTVAAFTKPSTENVIIIIGLFSWPPTARVVRSQTLTLRNRPFIETSLMSGMRDLEVILKVIIPNELPLVFQYATLATVYAIVLESGFDLVGVGSLNSFTLGTMLYFAFANNALLLGKWWWFIVPGLCIGLFGTGLLLLGYGVERINGLRG